MNGRSIWTLLLVTALVGVSGSALAQELGLGAEGETDLGLEVEAFQGELIDDGLGEQIGQVDLMQGFGDTALVGECMQPGAVAGVGDVHREAVKAETVDQNVDVETEDILLSIALANNGATDIDWNTVRDFTRTETAVRSADYLADLDRDSVFNALALGVDADGGALEALACVSNMNYELVVQRVITQQTDLEEEQVLLAIALANSVGSDLVYEDIADIQLTDVTEVVEDRQFDLDRDDTFLALALGAGGEANGGLGGDFGGEIGGDTGLGDEGLVGGGEEGLGGEGLGNEGLA